MRCKNLRIRTKKGVHYKYCTLLKKEITNECYNCINKEYKEVKKLSTKNVNKLNKRNTKITKLERNRTSIFTNDLNHYIICGNNKELDLYYKRKCQKYFENNIGSRLEFIRIFGKSYS